MALFPELGQEAGDLMRCADRAMYRTKQARSGYQIY
ncbi:MAG: GGDEF domain-containing protein [Candidatus Manganitrophus sp. SB1]|nr:GGDEF domain-containing protein [Candidatus Manganitrophus morganii]